MLYLLLLLNLILAIAFFLRYRKKRKLYKMDYVFVSLILLLGFVFIYMQASNYQIKNRLKSKVNIITKTVEINKLDTLKTDLEKLEYFVTSIESIDLTDTPDDFKIAFKDYCQEFRVALNAAKKRGYILSNNNDAIQNANERLMEIYRSY